MVDGFNAPMPLKDSQSPTNDPWLGRWWDSGSKLPGIGRVTGKLDVDFSADVHPCTQPEIDTHRAIDELLKLLGCDAFAHFPDAESRSLWTHRAKGVVIETSLEILGNSVIPTATRSHGCLRSLPPLRSLARAEFMVNVEELGCHGSVLLVSPLYALQKGSASRRADRGSITGETCLNLTLAPREFFLPSLSDPVVVHLADPELGGFVGTGERRRSQYRPWAATATSAAREPATQIHHSRAVD